MKTAATTLLLITASTPGDADAIGDYLRSLGEDQIFALEETKNDSGVRFRFIEGDRSDKAAHAFPMRVTITVLDEPKKLERSVTIRGKKEGPVFKRRDRKVEKTWAKRITEAVKAAESE